MPSDLNLPGDIDGLLRRGSPVLKTWYTGEGDGIEEAETLKGLVVCRLEDDIAGQRWRCWFDGLGKDVGFAPHLDLTDATGRAHAAWWLHKWACGTNDIGWLLSVENALGLWLQSGWSDRDRRVFWDSLDDWLNLSGDLDHKDPRLLEDGSRWVDAEALRLVCLHVAGRSE